MAKNQRVSKGKTIKPTCFIFCEGESEDAYIGLLKRQYRVPVEITTKVAGSSISRKYIDKTLKLKSQHPKDKIFLLYDLDVPEITERLKSISGTILLASNPCFELWYILHYDNHATTFNSKECVQKFSKICENYKKGKLSPNLETKLTEGRAAAIIRAKKLTKYENPSTTAYLLIEELEAII